MPGSTNFPGSLDSHTSGSPKGFAEVVNLLSTTLSGAINAAVTTIPVTSTASFPSAGIVVIRDGVNPTEVIYYTSTDATNFIGCTRGSGGTSAAIHNAGGAVACVPVAAMHNDIAAAIVAVETKLGTGSSTPTNQTLLGGTGAGTSGWTASPTVSGTLTATGGLSTSGAISGGAISGTTGTFSSSISALAGTFSSTLTTSAQIQAASALILGAGSFSGAITGASLAVSGTITGTAITGTGAVAGATLTSSGTISGTGISGTTGAFSGAITCASLTASGGISLHGNRVSTGYGAPNLEFIVAGTAAENSSIIVQTTSASFRGTLAISGATGNVTLLTSTTTTLVLGTNNTERLRFNGSGGAVMTGAFNVTGALTVDTTASIAGSMIFVAGRALVTTSATVDPSGATPATATGFMYVSLNGTAYKVALYS